VLRHVGRLKEALDVGGLSYAAIGEQLNKKGGEVEARKISLGAADALGRQQGMKLP
jgi:hypothetical protein